MSETYIRLIQRRDISVNWQTENPVLDAGEWGYETDSKKIKIGDGTTAWNALPYFTSGGGVIYNSGNGINVDNDKHTISVDTNVMATTEYVNTKIGDINAVLSSI